MSQLSVGVRIDDDLAATVLGGLGKLRIRAHCPIRHRLANRNLGLSVRFGRPLVLIDHIDKLGQAPVEHPGFAEFPQHHVLWLEVAMQNSVPVSEADRLTNRDELPQQTDKGQMPLAAPDRQLMECDNRILHVDPFHVLHRVVQHAVFSKTQIVDRHDAGMLKLPGELNFLDEPIDNAGVLKPLRLQFLEGNTATNDGIFGQPDLS